MGHAAPMGDRRSVYRVLGGKPEGKRPLERHVHRWEDNINRISNTWEGMDWTDLSKDRDSFIFGFE